MADYTNLLKVKEKEKSPDSPGAGEALNLDSGDSHG